MSRPSFDDTYMDMLPILAERGTCIRRRVACILTDVNNQILATGYNGVHRKATHCIDIPCKGSSEVSGSGLDLCEAIHAEQNALLQCFDVNSIYNVYVSCSPCVHCVKLLLQTSAQRIVFLEDYVHSIQSKELWLRDQREWIQYDPR